MYCSRFALMKNKVLTKIILPCVIILAMTSCEKDENGYFLSPNYCTATINGKEYIDRESYLFPLWGHSPRAELYCDNFYIGDKIVDITPVLIISSHLEPAKGNNGSTEYSLKLYIKNFKVDKLVDGQSYSFSYTSALDDLSYAPLDSIFKSMWKEDINVALISFEDTSYKSASGTIHFSCYDKKESNMNGNFEATVTLTVSGREPIQLEGYMYTGIM